MTSLFTIFLEVVGVKRRRLKLVCVSQARELLQ